MATVTSGCIRGKSTCLPPCRGRRAAPATLPRRGRETSALQLSFPHLGENPQRAPLAVPEWTVGTAQPSERGGPPGSFVPHRALPGTTARGELGLRDLISRPQGKPRLRGGGCGHALAGVDAAGVLHLQEKDTSPTSLSFPASFPALFHLRFKVVYLKIFYFFFSFSPFLKPSLL